MVAFHAVEGAFCGIEYEFGWVVAAVLMLGMRPLLRRTGEDSQEALSHVDYVCPSALCLPCHVLCNLPIGCFGEAAAASLTIDHTSGFCPATLLAGLNFSSILAVTERYLGWMSAIEVERNGLRVSNRQQGRAVVTGKLMRTTWTRLSAIHQPMSFRIGRQIFL